MSEILPVSAIIPSALRPAPDGKLWLERAIASVLAQTQPPKEIIIGIDPDAVLPDSFAFPNFAFFNSLRVVRGNAPGHQAAMNASVSKASYPLVAFLEDDDVWLPKHLEFLYRLWSQEKLRLDFIGSSQESIDSEGKPLGQVFDYPTASGWFTSRNTWFENGGIDERFRIHHDNDFFGRLNRKQVPRVHIVEKGADISKRPHLQLIARQARIVEGLGRPTVLRTVHPQSIMGGVAADSEKLRRSTLEYAACEMLYGGLENTW